MAISFTILSVYYGGSTPVPQRKQGFVMWGSLYGTESGHCPELHL